MSGTSQGSSAAFTSSPGLGATDGSLPGCTRAEPPESARAEGVQSLQISLPKASGAVQGLEEKLSVEATGAVTLAIQLAVSPGMQGFASQLTSTYNSPSGNSPFGFWSPSLPSMGRKASRGTTPILGTDVSVAGTSARTTAQRRRTISTRGLRADRGSHIPTRPTIVLARLSAGNRPISATSRSAPYFRSRQSAPARRSKAAKSGTVRNLMTTGAPAR